MSPSPSTPPRPRESEGPSWWRLGFALLVLKTMSQLSRILFAVTRSSRSEDATSTEARPEKESATPSPEPSSSALQSEVPQGEACDEGTSAHESVEYKSEKVSSKCSSGYPKQSGLKNIDKFVLGFAIIFPFSFLIVAICDWGNFSSVRDILLVATVSILPLILTLITFFCGCRSRRDGLAKEVNQKFMEAACIVTFAFFLIGISQLTVSSDSSEASQDPNAVVECKAMIKDNAVVEALECKGVKPEPSEAEKTAVQLILIAATLKYLEAFWAFILSQIKSEKNPKTAG